MRKPDVEELSLTLDIVVPETAIKSMARPEISPAASTGQVRFSSERLSGNLQDIWETDIGNEPSKASHLYRKCHIDREAAVACPVCLQASNAGLHKRNAGRWNHSTIISSVECIRSFVEKVTETGEKKYCFCIDFRALNAVTKKIISSSQTFETPSTELDMAKGYWQLEVDEKDKFGREREDTFQHRGCIPLVFLC